MAYFQVFLFVVLHSALVQLSPVHVQLPLTVGSTFEYLVGETSNFNTAAEVIFVDYETLNLDLKGKIKQQPGGNKKRIICYVNVGTWEDWRGDAKTFPKIVLGNDYVYWEEDKWLDIRRIDLLGPIMEDRFKLAKANGCEGIDTDNVDGYDNETGFKISKAQQLAYNRFIASAVRKQGLLVGLKNDPEQAAELVEDFDFAVTESCVTDDFCGDFNVFVKNSKPVFAVEWIENYEDSADFLAKACPIAESGGFDIILKEVELFNNYTVRC